MDSVDLRLFQIILVKYKNGLMFPISGNTNPQDKLVPWAEIPAFLPECEGKTHMQYSQRVLQEHNCEEYEKQQTTGARMAQQLSVGCSREPGFGS